MTTATQFPEWQHKFVATKPLLEPSPYARTGTGMITVEAGLHYLRGNSAPYFSITATIGRDVAGCIHDEVVTVWPELAPVIALHLSDHDGAPMYAEGNGWFWLAGYYGGANERYHGSNGSSAKTPEECLRIFADHVRVPLEEAQALADQWRVVPNTPHLMPRIWPEVRAAYAAWITAQAPRWKAEADHACAVLDSLIASTAGEE